MKKAFFGILASMLLTSAAFADAGNKGHLKKVSKTDKCTKANCPNTCDKSKCVEMPGCICH